MPIELKTVLVLCSLVFTITSIILVSILFARLPSDTRSTLREDGFKKTVEYKQLREAEKMNDRTKDIAVLRVKPEKPDIRIFIITKDDYDLIDPWLFYHSKIFGENKIILCDNESTDERVFKIYKKYPSITLTTAHDYNQGVLATEASKTFDGMLVCLDSDEYLVTLDGKPDVRFIKHELKRMYDTNTPVFAYPVEYVTYTYPSFEDDIKTFPCGVSFGKSILQKSVVKTDCKDPMQHRRPKAIIDTTKGMEIPRGYHHDDFTCKSSFECELGVIHFHHRPYVEYLKRCLYTLSGHKNFEMGDLFDRKYMWRVYQACINKKHGTGGLHKAKAIIDEMERAHGGVLNSESDVPTYEQMKMAYESLDKEVHRDAHELKYFVDVFENNVSFQQNQISRVFKRNNLQMQEFLDRYEDWFRTNHEGGHVAAVIPTRRSDPRFPRRNNMHKHAERAVLEKLTLDRDTYGILVIRWSKGKASWSHSRPCTHCLNHLRKLPIRYCFYTDADGNLQKEEIRNMTTDFLTTAAKIRFGRKSRWK